MWPQFSGPLVVGERACPLIRGSCPIRLPMSEDQAHTKSGERSALEARRELSMLWARSHPMIASFIRSVVIDHHQSEDVLQETAATVAEKFDDYDRSRPFLPWVLGIARFKAIDSLRSISRDRLVFSDDIVSSLSETYAELEINASDVNLALENCVQQVSGRSRKLLEMRYLRDLNAHAIAAATGMTPGSVTVALHRIRKALGECIDRVLAGRDTQRSGQGGEA